LQKYQQSWCHFFLYENTSWGDIFCEKRKKLDKARTDVYIYSPVGYYFSQTESQLALAWSKSRAQAGEPYSGMRVIS
jgi:hypothetical protein